MIPWFTLSATVKDDWSARAAKNVPLDLHNIEISLVRADGFQEIVGDSLESVRCADRPTKFVFVDFRCHRVRRLSSDLVAVREAAISRKGREGGVREGPSEGSGAGSLPAIVTERHPVAWYTAAPAPAGPGDGRSSVRAPVRRMTTGFNCSINHYFRSLDVGPSIPIDQLVMLYELIFDYFIGMLSVWKI